MKRLIPLVAGMALAALSLSACSTPATAPASSAPASSAAGEAIKIAFLMPCSTCADRFESKDKPFFIEAVKALDPSIEVIANNAQGDAAVQLQQAEAALTNGAKVLVTSPFTAESGAAMVAKAKAAGATVVAYDGQIEGAVPDAYISFQNEKVGELQGQYLLDNLPKGSKVAMINGDITSAPGLAFKKGAHSVLDPAFASGDLTLAYESDTPGFDPATGQRSVEQALTKLKDDVQAILTPNDGLGNAAIVALTARGLNGKVLVTGQDATDAGLTSIVAGDQAMTVYKPIKAEAEAAAKIAVALAKGDTATVKSLATQTVNNGTGDIPSMLLDPVVVTAKNVADTVIADGFTTWQTICVGAAAQKCPKQ
jgi:ABC-type xylose transport system, periplasmic component